MMYENYINSSIVELWLINKIVQSITLHLAYANQELFSDFHIHKYLKLSTICINVEKFIKQLSDLLFSCQTRKQFNYSNGNDNNSKVMNFVGIGLY